MSQWGYQVHPDSTPSSLLSETRFNTDTYINIIISMDQNLRMQEPALSFKILSAALILQETGIIGCQCQCAQIFLVTNRMQKLGLQELICLEVNDI